MTKTKKCFYKTSELKSEYSHMYLFFVVTHLHAAYIDFDTKHAEKSRLDTIHDNAQNV